MKKIRIHTLPIFIILAFSCNLFSQTPVSQIKLGLHTGISTAINGYNTSGNSIFAVYLAPYFRIKKHEFHVGMLYPLSSYYGMDGPLNSHIGATAGYKYYLLSFPKWVNVFLYYEFQYLWFSGNVETGRYQRQYTETETNYNNIIGLGYSGFFDKNQKFGFSWSLGFIIPNKDIPGDQRNYLSSNLGFYFTLTSFKKKNKEEN